MNVLKKAIISLPLSLMIALFSFKGFAYSYTQDYQRGIYWSSLPVQMTRFAVDSSDGALLQTIVDESVSEWESAIGKEIWQISPVQLSSNYSGNYIRWSYNFAQETGYDATRTLAVTIRYNNGTHFSQVVIILNAGIGYLRQNFGGALKKTILHELGHTVGLDHSEETAIMAATLGSIGSLQYDDIRGMNALIDDTLYKQQIGYVAPQAGGSVEENKVAACGTIEDIGNGGSGGGNQFILSLILGLLTVIIGRSFKRPIYSVGYRRQ